MRDLILLYSDSTDTVLYNQNYGKEIKASEKPPTLGTNGEPMVTKQRYEVTELCEHQFNEKLVTNIISLAHMDNKYQVTYNQDKERACNTHMQDKTVKFKESDNGLYVMYPNSKQIVVHHNQQMKIINTVEENLKSILPRQVKLAKKASKLFE